MKGPSNGHQADTAQPRDIERRLQPIRRERREWQFHGLPGGAGLKTGAIEYHRGMRRRGRLIKELDRLMGGCDVLILPPFQDPAPPAEESTGSAFFNEPASQTGLPAITLPLGRGSANLPYGIQFVGRRLGDADLLSAAIWAEEEMGWRPAFPEI